MRDSNQTIIKFDYEKNYQHENFFLTKSNKHVFEFLEKKIKELNLMQNFLKTITLKK